MKKYDYLIVGAGLYGAVFAREAVKAKKTCLVIDKRNHIAGNIYTKEIEGIQVHEYGAHIFHTSNQEVWEYVNQFAEFNRCTNSPVANYKGEIYNLPFNMNTFSKLWGVVTPKEAKEKIEKQKQEYSVEHPKNLEEQAINLIGPDVYEKLVKGYTEKQWGKRATELPAFIIKRLPVRFTYDNNYFDDKYQGIPIGGYTRMVERMLEGVEVRLGEDFLEKREEYCALAEKVVYTGMADEYFGRCYGALEYRSLHFDTEVLEEENHQGNAVVNYTEYEVPYTRIIEHKHFEMERGNIGKKTVITREYPKTWSIGDEPYYPMNDEKNAAIYEQYEALMQKEANVIFGGRLGQYRYYDMDDTIEAALQCAKENLEGSPMKKLEEYVRSIEDFPEPGIIFRDVTSILQDADGLHLAIDGLLDMLKNVEYDVVVGPESRGFIFGVPVAYEEHKSFVPVRKKGKLPCETIAAEYSLEYGKAVLEMHKDSITPGQKVVIIDDLIATGGTIEAIAGLIEQMGGEIVKICFVMELAGLHGREKLSEYAIDTLITYEGK